MSHSFANLRLFLPINLLLGALAVIIYFAILETINQTSLLIQAILVVVMLNAAANAFNDYMDYEIDKINRPNFGSIMLFFILFEPMGLYGR